jgi:hypothetical protein
MRFNIKVLGSDLKINFKEIFNVVDKWYFKYYGLRFILKLGLILRFRYKL